MLQGSHICWLVLTDGSQKTPSSTTFMLILVSLPMFFYLSVKQVLILGPVSLSHCYIMHIAVGHVVIAQPFSKLIYWNIVNAMHVKLPLQRQTFAETTYLIVLNLETLLFPLFRNNLLGQVFRKNFHINNLGKIIIYLLLCEMGVKS